MEGSGCNRAVDGAYFDFNCSRDVFTRDHWLRLTLAYDGTNYFGWQKTPYGPTIEQELTIAWEKLTQEKIRLDAVSRTDRGVHAEGQIVQLKTSTQIKIEKIPLALNAYLPKDIRVKHAIYSSQTINPISKTYRYQISTGRVQPPFEQKYFWHYPYPIDLSLVQEKAPILLGTHDFSSFTTEKIDNPIRTLYAIEISQVGSTLQIQMTGDRFLYKMARTLAGTLANLGSGKIPATILKKLLQGNCRPLAGSTAPPNGLCLEKINLVQ